MREREREKREVLGSAVKERTQGETALQGINFTTEVANGLVRLKAKLLRRI